MSDDKLIIATHKHVEHLKPSDRDEWYRVAGGTGLRLLVRKQGGKYWRPNGLSINPRRPLEPGLKYTAFI